MADAMIGTLRRGSHVRCPRCGSWRKVTRGGVIERHYVVLPVSRRVVPVLGRGRVARLCSGSGMAPVTEGSTEEGETDEPRGSASSS
jgi:hypothetical protein